jgi:outer membrane biosynthesis protein TonB
MLQRQQAVQEGMAAAEADLKALKQELKKIDAVLDSLSDERQRYELLDNICSSLDQLSEMGGARIFWGEGNDSVNSNAVVAGARNRLAEFQTRFSSIEEGRQARLKRVEQLRWDIAELEDEWDELDEQIERSRYDFVIEREERPLPFRPAVMPWNRQSEDDRRFRKVLALALLLTLTFGGVVPYYPLPERASEQPVEIPEHLVRLVQERRPPPPPPPPPEQPPEERPREEEPEVPKPAEQEEPKPRPTPTPAETKEARPVAETSGVLAFRETFTDLLNQDLTANLGASASLSNQGDKADTGEATRNLVTAQARSSGGIQTAAVSRNVGGGGGDRIGAGVEFARVESAIGTDAIASERPLSDGVGPSRTDQEIQIVFDRYKAALYRIYNRELRVDPTLSGKMILRLTIEPDGAVSAVRVESTDLPSQSLSAQILERVRSFNFGPKDGVPAVTILYPIDFLPAS